MNQLRISLLPFNLNLYEPGAKAILSGHSWTKNDKRDGTVGYTCPDWAGYLKCCTNYNFSCSYRLVSCEAVNSIS